MIWYYRYMASHAAERITHGCPILYFQPFYSIWIVTNPSLRCIIKHSWIKTPSSACAGLKKHLRERWSQTFVQIINAQNIAMKNFSLLIRRICDTVTFRNAPVHIPFYIGYVWLRKQFCNHPINIIHNFFSWKIQYILISSMRYSSSRCL